MMLSVLVFGLAYHYAAPERDAIVDKYNNYNPGIGIMYHERMFYAAAGTYLNSVERRSNFAAIGVVCPVGKHAGLTFGAARLTGYSNENAIAPMVTVYGQFDRVRLHAAAMDGGVGFFMEISLGK